MARVVFLGAWCGSGTRPRVVQRCRLHRIRIASPPTCHVRHTCLTACPCAAPACLQLPVSVGNKRRRDLVDAKHEHGERSAQARRNLDLLRAYGPWDIWKVSNRSRSSSGSQVGQEQARDVRHKHNAQLCFVKKNAQHCFGKKKVKSNLQP